MEDAWKYLMQLAQNPGKSYPAFSGATDNWLGQLISRAQVPGSPMPTMPTGFGGGGQAPFPLDQAEQFAVGKPGYGQVHNELEMIKSHFGGPPGAGPTPAIGGLGAPGGGLGGGHGLGGYLAEPTSRAPFGLPGAPSPGRGLAA